MGSFRNLAIFARSSASPAGSYEGDGDEKACPDAADSISVAG